MPLLLFNDRNAIERKNEIRTRIAAAEASCVPEQTNNNEGCNGDLQIGLEQQAKKLRPLWTFKTIAP